ncbi:Sporulation thiol-disulfide oxidoreductase A [Pontiella desulfatans]|uniref:Sporulation thiol-disulfide oxidoreductase A n=1 Tax=Pontiella desulfatans TaxID=2750659 RepID=A0A6C2U6I7_PONDE|nr:thioredoxin-like domain-containing protein [Pontiella desulfatans]VGO15141.1 Sporulation thiol-disulfide oxidoreductase A [Pontiella desulfatans]
MKPSFAIFCTTALLMGGCGSSNRMGSLEKTLEGAVIDHNGNAVNASYALNTNHLLLYFSAHWCPPCRAFTPELVKFYNQNNGGQLFQVLLISNDHTDQEMQAYVRGAKMPWPAVVYHSEARKILNNHYSGQGIPRLVLLDSAGEIVADSFKGKTYLGPNHVLEELAKLLDERERDPAGLSKATGAPLATPEKFKRLYKIDGFGSGAAGNMAFINGKVTQQGAELDTGVVVENITGTYVEISFEGNRYRLKPE